MTFVVTKTFNTEKKARTKPIFCLKVAESDQEIEECMKLRYAVFAGEVGSRLRPNDANVDHDRFDPYCQHLMVVDSKTRKVIATTRLLMVEGATQAGSFASQTEFDLSRILSQEGRFMEVGKTCIHPYFRNGSVVTLLWQGIAGVIAQHHIDFLFSCGSISLRHGDSYVNSVMHYLRDTHYSSSALRVRPRIPLPKNSAPTTDDVVLPTLIKTYLHQGALVCGEPHWDAEFSLATLFLLLNTESMPSRYPGYWLT